MSAYYAVILRRSALLTAPVALLMIVLGAAAGLVFVYASDLPEIRALEDYRPSVVTELYADDSQQIGSFALQRLVSTLLFGVTAADAASGLAVVILAVVAMVACYLPALRATRVSPLNALRYE